jgi:hypothetical protein
LEIGSRKRALEIFRGTLPPQRSEEVQGRKMSSARRDHDFQRPQIASCRKANAATIASTNGIEARNGKNGGESGIRTRGTPLKGVQSLSRRSLSATQPSLRDLFTIIFRPGTAGRYCWRREQDSNPRTFRSTVFKTAAIDHSAIPPYVIGSCYPAAGILSIPPM